jgi:predicted ATPase
VAAVYNARNFLVELRLLRETVASFAQYPFTIPAIEGLDRLVFARPVTFLVGENGAGKSTLLEAIATKWGLNPEGGSKNFNFSTRDSHSALHQHLRLTRSAQRPADAYFLRAESYFNVATEIEKLDREPGGPPIISSYGGKSLHDQSHGESFFALFMHRMGAGGFYLFDEPEAALSPQRQLAFLTRLHDLVQAGSQFIIATHSPILMALPGAAILLAEGGRLHPTEWEALDHVRVTRAFLANPASVLSKLLPP